MEVITGHNEKSQKSLVDGIVVNYLHVPYDNSFGFGRRIFSFLQFITKSLSEIKKIKGIDLCYAISVPLTVGIIAMRLKSKYRIPFIFEVGDLWPEAPIQMGVVNNFFLRKMLFGMENRIYRSADFLVALSPAIKKVLESKVGDKKVFMIPNMSDTDFFNKTSKDQSAIKKLGLEGKFVVSYIGAIGEANGLDYFLECANHARKAGLEIHFIMCGEGAHKKRFENLIEKMGLQNLSVLAPTNREGVRELLNVTDAAFISYKPLPVLETGSPNKYFDALAAGKLVVINFGGWIRKDVEDNKCGIFVDPFQPTDFVRKITPFVEREDMLTTYQTNARSLAERSYSRRDLGEKFYQITVHKRA